MTKPQLDAEVYELTTPDRANPMKISMALDTPLAEVNASLERLAKSGRISKRVGGSDLSPQLIYKRHPYRRKKEEPCPFSHLDAYDAKVKACQP